MGFNTASGKYCCNKEASVSDELRSLVSIPQAVSTVATVKLSLDTLIKEVSCFNTASGKYCCNIKPYIECYKVHIRVSIPQAVSTVATLYMEVYHVTTRNSFQYRKR